MSESGATTPTSAEPPATPGALAAAAALDDRDLEPRTPMKRLGSTRKLAAFTNIRMQLCEQSRVLEARAEASAGVASELHEYCRRRAELEHEYARALDKLARAATQRHKDQKHKREHWPHVGAAACWQQALDGTRALAKEHSALADLYGGVLAARLQRAADDALRLHRKCRDVVLERHEELGAALAEAGAAGKTSAAAAADWRAAAAKLRHAHDQRERLAVADPPRPKKLKALDKELDKRRARHGEARARALRARADYLLSLEAANATLQRYYLDDVAEIMMCMEVGFEAVVGRAVRAAAAAEAGRAARAGAAADALLAAAEALDALHDRQRFLQAHAAIFTPPRPQTFQGVPPDKQDAEMSELLGAAAPDDDDARAAAALELRQRLLQLDVAARELRAEVRESAKTLEAAESSLLRLMEGSAWEAGADASADEAPRRQQEDYYLHKFRAQQAAAGRLARLDARAAALRLLVAAAPASPVASPSASPPRPRRGQFAAPLDDRLPLVLTSCVRVIATYGVRHQGIFRVSGSQVEMQALRAAFDRGEDPLAHVRDHADINSVCGLLKLYLRSLRPPLLPPALQAALLRSAAERCDEEFARRVRAQLAVLPAPALLVLRYLFSFLAYLTQHSAQNMMDAWNLAICLGPTLLAAWGSGGAQVAAQNLANELVKRIIELHRDCFPQDLAPHALFRPPALEPSDRDDRHDQPDAPDDHLYDEDDDDDDDDEISEDGESGEWQESNNTENHRSSSVERSQPSASSQSQPARLAESTPDLVLDLPARAPPASSSSSCPSPAPAAPASPASSSPAPAATALTPAETAPPAAEPDTADNFVHNRDTLKKRAPRAPSGSEAEGNGVACGGIGVSDTHTHTHSPRGSPVPARNTARVAAKFAELTLTGGSLKPALAAKPALLRRPTPHPQHARAAPADTPDTAPAASAVDTDT